MSENYKERAARLAHANRAIEEAAEAHRVEHSHTVYVRLGDGWVCEVCDADIFDAFVNGQEG